MSEPRWDDAGTRPLPRDTQGTYATQRTRSVRTPAGNQVPPPAERSPRWGGLPFGRGIVVVIATTALGTLFTILTGSDPGFVLDFCVLIGAIAASLAVRPGAVYRIVPAPALAYVVGAVIAGLIHDGGTDTSRTALVISGAQWTASGFLAMTAATVLVILIGAVRWGMHWHRANAIDPRLPASARRAAILRGAGSQPGMGSPRSAVGPRSAGSLRSTGVPRGTGSTRSAGGPRSTGSPRSAGGPRSTGSPRSAGGQRSAGGPRTTGNPRSTGSPRSTGNPRSTGSPRSTGGVGGAARPPNADGTSTRRQPSDPPAPGY
jgi:hypothetical protein